MSKFETLLVAITYIFCLGVLAHSISLGDTSQIIMSIVTTTLFSYLIYGYYKKNPEEIEWIKVGHRSLFGIKTDEGKTGEEE